MITIFAPLSCVSSAGHSFWRHATQHTITDDMARLTANQSQTMSLDILRADLPEWSWRAVRSGMGWRYEGHRGKVRATLQAVSALCGPSGDDFTVRWVVYETGESYTTWRCREIMRLRDAGMRD